MNERHRAPHPSTAANHTLAARDRTRPGAALVLLSILGLLVALVPAGPAGAAPAPSTMTLTLSNSVLQYAASNVVVTVSSATSATGVVVVTEGATALGQVTLQSDYAGWTGNMPISFATPGRHTITATYAGTLDVGPATASATIDVSAHTPAWPLTGTITTGPNVTPIGPGHGFSPYFYDPITGTFAFSTSETVPQTFTRDVPGTGPVSVTGHLYWQNTPVSVAPDGAVTASTMTVTLFVDLITVGGITWSVGTTCATSVALNATGALEAGGLHLTGSTLARFSEIAPSRPTACAGFATTIDAVFAGSASVDLHVAGPFPAPPPNGTATTTVVTIDGGPFTAGDRPIVHATVTAAFPVTPGGWITFDLDGVQVASVALSGGVAQAQIDVDTPGAKTLTARFPGVNGGSGPILVPSTGSLSFDVADGPPGYPTTGQVVNGSNSPITFAAGSRLTGATFDPATGSIDAGSFWFPVAQTTLLIQGFPITLRYRLAQVGPMTGQVARDGTVTFSKATFQFEGRAYSLGSGTLSGLGTCVFGPIDASLHGTADATGLHLTATGAQIPPVPSSDCTGYGSLVNSTLAGGASFTLEVAGDFRRDGSPTPVTVASWFPSVALHNQTYLSARVASSPNAAATGDVTFRDGPTVLGVAPVDATGLATLVAEMDQPGTRTITADYAGDAVHEPGTATTTMEVTPAPAGYALDGTVDVGGAAFPIGAGSTLTPAAAPGTTAPRAAVAAGLGTSTASLWFMPTTISLDLPGYGPVQAEVRLVQSGALTPASLGTGGSIAGLGGTFVLQVRKVTTATGTTRPLGCVNLVLLAFDGQLTFTDVDLASTNGGAGRIPWGTCTGPGQAVIDHLTGTSHATLHATL